MKNLIKFLFISVILISFSSCSKVQMNYNKIEGTWKLTEIKEDGLVIPITGSVNQIFFEKCPTTKTGCESNMVFNGVEEKFIYYIGVDGDDNQISMTSLDSNGKETIYSINKLDKSQLELTNTHGAKLIEFRFIKK